MGHEGLPMPIPDPLKTVQNDQGPKRPFREGTKAQGGYLTSARSLSMLEMQLLFEHKSGPQSRCHSLPEGEWAGLGKMPRMPAYLPISASLELTRTHWSWTQPSLAVGSALPPASFTAQLGSKPLSGMHPKVLRPGGGPSPQGPHGGSTAPSRLRTGHPGGFQKPELAQPVASPLSPMVVVYSKVLCFPLPFNPQTPALFPDPAGN